jgi:aminoglycoside 3-N-acetyltransferase
MADVTFRDLQKGLRDLGLTRESRVIAHASLSAFGQVRGGAETVVGALTSLCRLVVMPTFTYQCMVWPLVGPPDNAAAYTDHDEANANADIFRPDLPAHADMGLIAETLRRVKGALRSAHPLLSFAAVGQGAEEAMSAQSLAEPLGPIGHLAELEGDVLLLGVDHVVNTSIHYAEYRAGRKQFIRWALTLRGAVECVAWPGDSSGFNAIAPRAAPFARSTRIGAAFVQRLPLRDLLRVAEEMIRADPLALLCDHPACERCAAVRAAGSLAPSLAN